jgi:hypothetical protein
MFGANVSRAEAPRDAISMLQTQACVISEMIQKFGKVTLW